MAHDIFVYSPLIWQESLGYKVRLTMGRGKHAGKPRCRYAVHDEIGVGHHQCHKAGIVEVETTRHGTVWLCAIHDPEAAARRRAVSDAKSKADWDRRMRPYRMRDDFQTALETIAQGHNDPRAVAREALTKWGKQPAGETVEKVY